MPHMSAAGLEDLVDPSRFERRRSQLHEASESARMGEPGCLLADRITMGDNSNGPVRIACLGAWAVASGTFSAVPARRK